MLGIRCPFVGDGPGDRVGRNLHRRHLTASQRATLAVTAKEQLEVEAKERQRKAGRSAGSEMPDSFSKELEKLSDPIDSTREAAEMFGVNHQYVSDAEKIRD